MAASVIVPEGGPQYGCFIYQVVNPEGIAVWGVKNDEKSMRELRLAYDDLFEVDWILAKEGEEEEGSRRWMRLADGSGWINADHGESVCKEVTSVEDGLWKFFSFCATGSLVVHTQPSDRPELQSDQILWPFQKVFCDKRVKGPSGMTFYRIQGTHGWVYSSKNDNLCLYPDMLVSAKLQVFQALEDQEITLNPTDDSAKGTGRKVHANYLVAVDHSIVIPNDKGNGPFLRLADHSGWLMVSRNGKIVMTQVDVQDGLWDFQVENDPDGVTLMNQPIDSDDYFIKTDVTYKSFERIQCDKEVQSPSSAVLFYRVKGTTGWIPDRRLLPSQSIIRPDDLVEHPMLSLITCHDDLSDSTKRGSAGQEYNGDADKDYEETWRQALNRLEIEYADHRNHMLQKIHALDLLHSSTACLQAKEQTARLEELDTKRRYLEQTNTKVIEEQLEKFQKKLDIEWARKNRGDKFEFQIFSASKITLSNTDLMFAMGGAATLAVNESRILRYTEGLPKDMLHLLEKETLALPLASVVALGSENRYFIRFANDKMERWCVKNDELEIILLAETVEFVAFGASRKSFVTKTPSGMKWSCIPEELETILKEDRPIHSVSLGPNGEYFVAWKDGACTGGRWSGSKIDEALDRLKEGGWHIRDMKFGAESTFIIRYSDYDGPF